MKKFLILAAALLVSSAAFAQSVQQSGSITPNTVPRWVSTGIIGGTTTAADSAITNFGVTRDGADGICVSSARQSAAGRNTLCLQASTSAAAKIVLQNYGSATAQDLQFVINGTTVTLPTGGSNFVQASGALVSGNFPKWSGTSGLVIDSGMTAATGTQYGLAYYTASGAIGSIAAGTNGQIPVATTGAAMNWRSLSGDVASVTAAGVVTLQSVNGVTYPSSYSANGVLYASSTTAVTSTVTANTGYCLLSQGLSSAPIWAACASGSGSAGGADTQVQFNNATSLGGSANLTWVSPALRIGVSGTTTGQLQLNSSAGASGVVTLQAPTATAAYNFNLPTGAGSSGQPLISGGGGATAMTFGTLGVSGGGTNCSAASGTCLDNITSFSSTGYINRTGSGTYAFSTVIPVSGGGTNLASGTSGGILGYTASGVLASSGALTANAVIIGGGAGATPSSIAACTNGQIIVGATGSAPACQTLSGDITTVTSGGAVTIANSAISLAKMANAAAYSIYGNFTGSSAAPQVSTIGGLTQKASPAAGDLLLLQDQAASGQLKYATVSSVASAGSVSDIDGLTGSFTTSNGVTASGNVIGLTAARRTLPTVQVFTSGSGTYTTPGDVLWIEILLVGGGGGGAGSGSGPGGATSGGATCWNTSGAACTTPVYSAGGGSAAVTVSGGTGGSVTGSSTCQFPVSGGTGGNSNNLTNAGGGHGGASTLGGQAYGYPLGASTGIGATANTGSGGSGSASGGTAGGGGGGGAGATCRTIIGSPAASYTYAVGAAGAAGTAGSGGANGGAGAAGRIMVIEHYGT